VPERVVFVSARPASARPAMLGSIPADEKEEAGEVEKVTQEREDDSDNPTVSTDNDEEACGGYDAAVEDAEAGKEVVNNKHGFNLQAENNADDNRNGHIIIRRDDAEHSDVLLSHAAPVDSGVSHNEATIDDKDGGRGRDEDAVTNQERCCYCLSCAICMSEFEDGDLVCGSNNAHCIDHYFHQDCIVEWLMSNNGCPCCRRRFLNFDGDPEAGSCGDEDNSNSTTRRLQLGGASSTSIDSVSSTLQRTGNESSDLRREATALTRTLNSSPGNISTGTSSISS